MPQKNSNHSDKPQPAKECCNGPPPQGQDACCADDATAKSQGKSGCGCNDEVVNESEKCCG